MDFLVWIILGAVVVIVGGWLVATQRKLAVLDENINNAMSQIGVLLSSRFDALTALLDLTKGYAEHEYKTISDTVKSRRTMITADSTAAEAKAQENLITEALGRINAVAEAYPELKANENFRDLQAQLEGTENRITKAVTDFNEGAQEYNTKVRRFPTSIFAGMFGFKTKPHFKAKEGAENAPTVSFE